ncbi:DUF2341 domain-containing protein [Methanolobus sp. ZRKC2]|uniref:DUF2341 domain-containing protein n=1 Tax=Methanolobus sp. ZRKC2 TaxID=3125783 RepID=UPI00324BB43F
MLFLIQSVSADTGNNDDYFIAFNESGGSEEPQVNATLSYWIEGVDSDDRTFMKVDELAPSETEVYAVQKENGYAPNGDDVFDFFENAQSYTEGTNDPGDWSIDSYNGYNGGISIKAVSSRNSYDFGSRVLETTGVKDNSGWVDCYVRFKQNITIPQNNYIFESRLNPGYKDYFGKCHAEVWIDDALLYNDNPCVGSSGTCDQWYNISFSFNDSCNVIKIGNHFDSLYTGTTRAAFDDIVIRKYASIEPTVLVEDMGTWYKVTITNNATETLNDYQVPIPSADLNISSTEESLYIVKMDSSQSVMISESDFTSNKIITISPSSDGTLTDYQMSFAISYEPEMQSDFDDLRLTDENGVLLPYWIEEKTDSTSAKVWVKVPVIDGTNGATIRMYYGNSTVSSAENGEDVFEFFDDFDGTSLNASKWFVNLQSGGSFSVSNSILYLNNPVEVFSTQVFDSSTPYEVVFDSRLDNLAYGCSHIGFMDPTLSNMSSLYHYRTGRYYTRSINNGSSKTNQWPDIEGIEGEYHKWYIQWNSGSNVSTSIENGNVYSVVENVTAAPLNVGISTRLDTIYDHDSKVWTDWVYVRKCTENEPEYSISDIVDTSGSARTIVISNSGSDGELTDFQYTLDDRNLPDYATGYEYLHYYYDSNFTQEIPQYRDETDSSIVTLKLDLNNGNTIIYERAEDEEAVSDILSVFDLIEGLDTGGTITASRTPEVGTINNILDNSTSTSAYYKNDYSTYIVRDFGEPVYMYKLRTAFGTAASTQYIKVSNDGSTWTTLASWPGADYRSTVTPWYSVDNSWRYIKLEKSGIGWHSYHVLNVLSRQDAINTISHTYELASSPNGTTNSSISESDFTNNKTIIISPSTDGTLTDYQMSFDIGYETGMQLDFDDLRFTDENETLLPYWIEDKNDSSSVKVWVKVPVIDGTNGATLKMYYGNSTVESESDGDAVFKFFDDFSSSLDTDKWTTVYHTPNGGNCDVVTENGKLKVSVRGPSYSVKTEAYAKTQVSFNYENTPLEIEFSADQVVSSGEGAWWKSGFILSNDTTMPHKESTGHYTPDNGISIRQPQDGYGSEGTAIDVDSYVDGSSTPIYYISHNPGSHKFNLIMDKENVTLYVDDVMVAENVKHNLIEYDSYIYFLRSSDQYIWNTQKWDYVMVRQHAPNEPIYSIEDQVPENTLPSIFSNNKTITISPSTDGTLTDYQMSFDIDYEAEMQPDFDDLRFIDENGTLLPYWIEEKIDGSSAKVWVKIPVIDGLDGSTVKLHYGNSTVSSKSNGSTVFEFFDDFENTAVGNTGGWSLEKTGSFNTAQYIKVILDDTGDYTNVMETYVYQVGDWAGWYYTWARKDLLIPAGDYIVECDSRTSHTDATYRKTSIQINEVFKYQAAPPSKDWLHHSYNILDSSITSLRLGQYANLHTAYNRVRYDDVIIRKYTLNEPTYIMAEGLAAPSGLVATGMNTFMRWDWNDVDGADSYNVSLSDGWHNGTVSTTIDDTSISAHGNSTIEVFAYNATYNTLSEGAFSYHVLEDNVPIISDVPTSNSVTIEDTINIDVNATDLDSDTLTFGCNRTDLFSDFNTSSGEGSWSISPFIESGTYDVEFTVSDGYGGSNSSIMSVNVTNNLSLTQENYYIDIDYASGNVYVMDNVTNGINNTYYIEKTSGYSRGGDSVMAIYDDCPSSIDTSVWENHGMQTSTTHYISSRAYMNNAGSGGKDYVQLKNGLTLPQIPIITAWMWSSTYWTAQESYIKMIIDGQPLYWGVRSGTSKKNHVYYWDGSYHVATTSKSGWDKLEIVFDEDNFYLYADANLAFSDSYESFDDTYLVMGDDIANTHYAATWIDEISIKQSSHLGPDVTVTDMGSYYQVDVASDVSLIDYQIPIPVKDLGLSSWSDSLNIQSVDNGPATYPPKPVLLDVTADMTSVTHNWVNNTGIATGHYEVYDSGILVQNNTNTSYTDVVGFHNASTITIYAVSAGGYLSDGVRSEGMSNLAPVMDVIGDGAYLIGQTITVDVNATDDDDVSLIYGCNRTDLFTDFSTSDGTGTWTTSALGEYVVKFTVDDGNGGIDTENVTYTVVLPPDTPTNLDYTTGIFNVNWTWTPVTGADLYYVNVDDTWYNDTATPYFLYEATMDSQVAKPHSTSNITIYSYNSTYEILSETYLGGMATMPNHDISITNFENWVNITDLENVSVAITYADSDNDDYPGENRFDDATVASGTTVGWTKGGIGTMSAVSRSPDYCIKISSVGYDMVWASQTLNLTDVSILSMRHVYSDCWSPGEGAYFQLDGSTYARFHDDWSNRVINKNVSNLNGMHTVTLKAIGGTMTADDFFAIAESPDYDTITYGCNRTDLISDFNTSTGTGTFKSAVGIYPVEFTVSDGYGSTDSYVIIYNVSASNNPVTITDVPTSITVTETESISIDANASDIDDDTFTFSCNRTDLFPNFNSSDGTGTWDTNLGDAGTYYIEFGVDDNAGSTDNQTMEIVVINAPLPNGTTSSNISVNFLEPSEYSLIQAGESIDFILEARDNTTKFDLDGFSGYVKLEGPEDASEHVFLSNVNGNLSGQYYVEENDPDGVWLATATVYNSTLVINETTILFKTGPYIIQSYAESSAYVTGQDINFTAIAFSADNVSQYLTLDDLNMSLELYPYNNSTSAFGPVFMQYDSNSHEFGYTVNSGSIGQGVYTAIITGDDGNSHIENASMQIGISDDFNVNVDVDSKSHNRAETVGIYGSAEYLDGTPMVNTSVSLLLDVDGFQRSYTVTTNESGDFTYAFEPLSNEAGTYLLNAYVVNNGIGRSADTDFVIHGLRIRPVSSTIDMCENSTHSIQLELSNLGDTTLTGLSFNITDTDPADNVTLVVNGSIPSELAPDESIPILLNVQAGSLVTENTTFDLRMFNNQTECTANLTVNLFSDTPVLKCQPGNIEVGLNKNQTTTKTVTLYNAGYGNLQNVTLEHSGSQWFTITTDTHLGDILPGDEFSFDINLNSYNVDLGTYTDTVRVVSDNHDDVQIGLALYVTNLPSGSVNFNVSDSIGRQIPGAEIMLLNRETYDDYYGSTNSSGNALFTNLKVGKYFYDISSDGTNTLPQRGYLEVEPSPVPDEIDINLMMKLGNYHSTITPIDIDDTYQVILNGTFETDVPVPIIVASPPNLVYSLEPGDEISDNFKLSNYGLISAYDVSVSAVSYEGVIIEPLVNNIDNLKARSSVEIPFKIKINESDIKSERLKGHFDITSNYVHYVNDKKVATCVGTQVPVYVKIIDDVNLKINPQYLWLHSVSDTLNPESHLPVTYELHEKVVTAQNLETDKNIILSPAIGASLDYSIETILKHGMPDGGSGWAGEFEPYVIKPNSTATLNLTEVTISTRITEILNIDIDNFLSLPAVEFGILGFSYGKVDTNVSQDDVNNWIPMYYYTERAYIPICKVTESRPTGNSSNDKFTVEHISYAVKEMIYAFGGIPHAFISLIEDREYYGGNDGGSSLDYSGTPYIPPDDIEWINIPPELLIEEPFSIINETVHVKVKITIPQLVFMEREAFQYDVEVFNKGFNDEWENVSFDLNIRQNGTLVNDMFFTNTPELSGIDAIDGSGVLPPSSPASAEWLIIPNTGTGGTDPEGESYTISTTISYSINGEIYEMEMESFEFTVLPCPEMVLDYCIPANVEGNEPFKLMVVATNDGYGPANHFSIESSQPLIYEDLSGLLIDFKIIESQLQGEPRSNSLTIDFGDILPGESKIATWDMVTTLDGEFTEFTGEYTHAEELGGVATSLIREINTHIIQSPVDGMEETYDYIMASKLNEEQYTLIDSSSGISRSVKNANYTLVGNDSSSASLDLSMETHANEWMVASIDDPFNNEVPIEKVVRTLDDSEIPAQNSWLSDGKIFLLDYCNGGFDGNYSVQFERADLQANFSANITSGLEPLSVQFTDLSTGANNWTWDFGDGSNVSGTLAPTHVYADNGVYNVTLTVTDDDGGIDTDALEITVSNVAPVIDIGSDVIVDEGDVVSFFGNYSDTGTADTHTFVWDFGDGSNATDTLVPTHVYADNGVYNVTLTVTDDDGGIGTDTLEVTVNNVAPVVDIGSDVIVDEGDIVSFFGNYSDNGTADTHTIEWDFGDGSNSSDTLTPEHVYVDDGVYNVTLIVTDDDGGTGTDTLEVIVTSSNERTVTVNLQDSSGLPLTEGIVKYYDGGWQDFGTTDEHGEVSKKLPVGNYKFRMSYAYGSNEKYQNVGINSTVVFSTVDATIELRDSNGSLLDNGSAQYYSGNWYDLGSLVNGSSHVELLPNNYKFRMSYAHGSNEKYQDVGTNSTVVFSTVDATIELRDSNGNLLDNGSAQYYSGSWYDLGALVNGSSHIELLPNNYKFRMSYAHGSNEKYQNVGTNSTVVFSTVDTTVELRDSNGNLLDNGSAQYYSGSWYDLGALVNGSSHVELLPNNYKFRMSYAHGSNEKYQNVGINSTVVFSTVDTTVELRDSNGNLLDNGSAQYYSGSWYDLGALVNGSSHVELLPNNYKFRMSYAYGSNEKYQNVGINSTVVFSTVDATIELRDSNGSLLDNGSAQYYSGSWYDLGALVNGSSHIELLPNNYKFRMSYAHGSNEKYQDVGTNSTVVFSTVDTTVELRDSNGSLLDNGSAQYYSGKWYDLGALVNGSSHVELLPNNYKFRMSYAHGSNEKYQDVGTNSTVVFSTVDTTVELRDSNGSLLDNGSVQYYSGSWYDLGALVNGSSHVELLPNNYKFRMSYAHGSNEKYQNVGTNSTVVFSTVDTTVELRDSNGNLLDNGSAQYYSGSWYDLGALVNGSSHVELLPNNYKFRMSYAHGSNEKYQDIGTNPNVVFFTGKIISDSDTCIHYYSGGWQVFTNGMELLSGSYKFRFNDGTSERYYSIGSSTVNTIY